MLLLCEVMVNILEKTSGAEDQTHQALISPHKNISPEVSKDLCPAVTCMNLFKESNGMQAMCKLMTDE